MTLREAISNFCKNSPQKQLPLGKLGATVPQLREQFQQKDSAGDKQVTKEMLVQVLGECKVEGKEADDLATGFFRVADKANKGKVDYEDFLQELIRMQTYKVIRFAQFDLAALDAKNGKFDKAHKVKAAKLQSLLEGTNIGAQEAKAQIDELLSVQIGKNVDAVTIKAMAQWYFPKYYPDIKITPTGLKFPAAKTYVESVVSDLSGALSKSKASTVGTEDNVAVNYNAGKLMGIMEFVETSLHNAETDSAKIFGNDDEFTKVTKVIEGCQAASVQF